MANFRGLWRAIALGLSLVLAGSALGAPAQAATGPSKYVEGADSAAWLFDPLNINRIDLTIPQASLQTLATDSYQNQIPYQESQMVFSSYKGTLPSMDVGVHIKGGLGSRRKLATCDSSNFCGVVTDQKPALKIKINFGAANASQRLYGLKELTLNSMVQDQSMLHETVDYRLARAAGLPAPRTGYIHVYANGVDLGLHLLVEAYDSTMMKRWSASGTQSLYEGAYWQDIVLSSPTVQSYQSLQKHSGDPVNSDDLARVATIQGSSGIAWWVGMTQWTNVGELTRDWAFEHFVQQWDAYSWFIINNYFVHFDNTGVMTMHPWGMDQTLIYNGGDYAVHFLASSSTPSGRPAGTLFAKCLAYTPCKQLYVGELAKLGETADSLNLPGFIDEVWAAIGADVLADPISHGSGAQNAMAGARSFIAGRTKNAEYLAAVTTRKVARITLDYPAPTNFTANQTITPNFVNSSGNATTFKVIGDTTNPKCSVDSSTGVVTALQPGFCSVSASSLQGDALGFHAAYTVAQVDLGKIAGTVSIAPIAKLQYQVPVDLAINANSTGAQTVTVKGSCSYLNGLLMATKASGECVLTVSVAKDDSHTKATLTKTIPLARAREQMATASNENGWFEGAYLPQGKTLKLLTKPSKVTGSCTHTGTLLKATGLKGYCKVTLPTWTTTNTEYLGRTFVIRLAPSAQTWVQKVAAPVTLKSIGTRSYTLAPTNYVTTTSGNPGTFEISGVCEWAGTAAETALHMTGTGTCRVTLSADAAFKVKAIKRVWSFTN